MKSSGKRLTPAQRLRNKLYPIKFTENIETSKKRVNWKKLLRLAKKVKETFKDEYTSQPNANL